MKRFKRKVFYNTFITGMFCYFNQLILQQFSCFKKRYAKQVQDLINVSIFQR